MKKTKSALFAFAVVVLVGSALAFRAKAFSLGNVWCFSTFPNPSQSCSSQERGTQIFVTTVASGGSTLNPCQSGKMPSIDGGNQCLTPPIGQQYLSE